MTFSFVNGVQFLPAVLAVGCFAVAANLHFTNTTVDPRFTAITILTANGVFLFAMQLFYSRTKMQCVFPSFISNVITNNHISDFCSSVCRRYRAVHNANTTDVYYSSPLPIVDAFLNGNVSNESNPAATELEVFLPIIVRNIIKIPNSLLYIKRQLLSDLLTRVATDKCLFQAFVFYIHSNRITNKEHVSGESTIEYQLKLIANHNHNHNHNHNYANSDSNSNSNSMSNQNLSRSQQKEKNTRSDSCLRLEKQLMQLLFHPQLISNSVTDFFYYSVYYNHTNNSLSSTNINAMKNKVIPCSTSTSTSTSIANEDKDNKNKNNNNIDIVNVSIYDLIGTQNDRRRPRRRRIIKYIRIKKVMLSNAKPLLIECLMDDIKDIKNTNNTTKTSSTSTKLLLKFGDDLRKDAAVLNFFQFLNHIWMQENVRVFAFIYKCIPMTANFGAIEFVDGCTKIGDLERFWNRKQQRENENNHGDHSKDSTRDKEAMQLLLQTMIESAIGCFVCGLIVGVRDRHHENILITEDGVVFHIDFAYILGEKIMGLDAAKIVIPSAFVDILGQELWSTFIELACDAYCVLRRYRSQIIEFALNCFDFMYTSKSVVQYLKKSLSLDLDEQSARRYIRLKFLKSPKRIQTKLKNVMHDIAVRRMS